MQYKKAVELIGYNKLKVRTFGFISLVIFFCLGILASIKWKWYALPLVLFVGWLLGYVFSYFWIKRMEKITGLSINGQIIAYHESLAYKQHPIAKDFRAYRALIDSMPDEEDSAWPAFKEDNNNDIYK